MVIFGSQPGEIGKIWHLTKNFFRDMVGAKHENATQTTHSLTERQKERIKMLDMRNYGTEQKDNTVVVNGVTFKATDTVAMQIIALLQGKTIEEPIQTVQSPTPKTIKTTKTAPNYKDCNIVWNTEKCATPSGKARYTLRAYGENGKPLYYRTMTAKIAKALVKGLGDGRELVVFDSSDKEYSMMVFKTLKSAKAAIETLPTVITAKQQQAYVENGYSL